MPITRPVIRGDIEREIQLRAIEDSSPDSIWSRVLGWMDKEIEARAEELAAEWDDGEDTEVLNDEIDRLVCELDDAEATNKQLEAKIEELEAQLKGATKE